MGLVLVTDSYLKDIGDAIRTKLGVATKFKPSEMAAAILTISAGGSVTLKGAPSSTVTYTGAASGSVSLNSSGEGVVLLDAGTYTFTNTVTIGGTTFTAYTKTVAVASDMTVNLFPSGMIYHFGRAKTSIADGASYTNPLYWENVKNPSNYTNYVQGSAESAGSPSKREAFKWGSAAKIDTTGFTALKARAVITWTGGSADYKQNVIGFMSSKNLGSFVKQYSFGTGNNTGTSAITISSSLPSTPGEYYLGGYAGYHLQASWGLTMKILALWLE